ncbi:hypothetical protein, partial [Paraburkholderia sp. MM5384-R2]|uniref:hypothetical protein n=1 Tax=Paraburkholderia sp. MM5384-R2 TaxID=2723097 RepID=UPI00160D1443
GHLVSCAQKSSRQWHEAFVETGFGTDLVEHTGETQTKSIDRRRVTKASGVPSENAFEQDRDRLSHEHLFGK